MSTEYCHLQSGTRTCSPHTTVARCHSTCTAHLVGYILVVGPVDMRQFFGYTTGNHHSPWKATLVSNSNSPLRPASLRCILDFVRSRTTVEPTGSAWELRVGSIFYIGMCAPQPWRTPSRSRMRLDLALPQPTQIEATYPFVSRHRWVCPIGTPFRPKGLLSSLMESNLLSLLLGCAQHG